MKLQRITLDPLARIERPTDPERDGRRCIWDTELHGPVPDGYLPAGEAYVPIVDRPDFDPATQRVERTLTAEADGWSVIDLTPEEIAARVPVHRVTKLTIMRRLDALGKWTAFKGLLAALPESVQDAWTLAQDIRSDDPLFVANAATIQAALDLTDTQFASLLAPAEP